MGGSESKQTSKGISADLRNPKPSLRSKERRTLPKTTSKGASISTGPADGKSYDYKYNVILIGELVAGKTCVFTRFSGVDKFIGVESQKSIGPLVKTRHVCLDETRMLLELWDVISTSRARDGFIPYIIQMCHGIIIVYDSTSKKSFDNVPYFIEMAERHRPQHATMMLVGTKCDLTTQKVIDYYTARDFADEKGIMFIEVSAKDGVNTELALMTLAAQIKKKQHQSLLEIS